MLCPNCGKEVTEGTFCGNCGTRIVPYGETVNTAVPAEDAGGCMPEEITAGPAVEETVSEYVQETPVFESAAEETVDESVPEASFGSTVEETVNECTPYIPAEVPAAEETVNSYVPAEAPGPAPEENTNGAAPFGDGTYSGYADSNSGQAYREPYVAYKTPSNTAPASQPGQGNAIAALVLGIVAIMSWVTGFGAFIGLITGILGLIFASNAKKQGYSAGLQTGGFVCSLIGLIGSVVVLLIIVVIIVALAGMSSALY